MEKKLTNKDKALQQMDIGFEFLNQVWCKGTDLDNMARARDFFRAAWELLKKPDKPNAEVKNNAE